MKQQKAGVRGRKEDQEEAEPPSTLKRSQRAGTGSSSSSHGSPDPKILMTVKEGGKKEGEPTKAPSKKPEKQDKKGGASSTLPVREQPPRKSKS